MKKLVLFLLFGTQFLFAQNPFFGYLTSDQISTNSARVVIGASVSSGTSDFNIQYSSVSVANLSVAPSNTNVVTVSITNNYLYPIFSLTSLSANTTYYWRVRATTSTGFVYSNAYSFTTTAIAPSGNFPQIFNFNSSVKNIENSISFEIGPNDTYGDDRNGNPNSAIQLANGTQTLVPNIPVGNSARSFSIWIKPTSIGSDNHVFGYGMASGESAYGISFNASTVYNFAWNTNISASNSSLLNQWHHIVTTYDASQNAKMYIDGALVSNQNRPNWNTASNSYFYLGDRFGSDNNSFVGYLDDLKIYNYALSQADITSLYTNNTLSSQDFNQNNLKVSLYPNPANDVLNIETDLELKSIEIYNIQGQKVLSSTQKQINVSDLAAGIYMVKIQDAKNAIATKKFMKE
ncbi:MAG: LamG-like jellyroll fold domain-containing protein [Flavobacterium sp.]|uniref:LamG-like jellyroll fold domain-containing protein n=1 Tax=Flavobacterium sp. TaxID=239 RepID=UPI003262E752